MQPEKFDYSQVPEPGIYRDDTYYDEDESVDESYTVIVPYSFLTPELSTEYIQKLN